MTDEEPEGGALGPGSVAGGAGSGVPGGPPADAPEPGEGVTADEATGITGDPDEERASPREDRQSGG